CDQCDARPAWQSPPFFQQAPAAASRSYVTHSGIAEPQLGPPARHRVFWKNSVSSRCTRSAERAHGKKKGEPGLVRLVNVSSRMQVMRQRQGQF
ncbi:MAG: hypothetical protein KDE23_26370, partial [Caldilinea sp.]|nr:hypothetical protein [Caldilinea sp.]